MYIPRFRKKKLHCKKTASYHFLKDRVHIDSASLKKVSSIFKTGSTLKCRNAKDVIGKILIDIESLQPLHHNRTKQNNYLCFSSSKAGVSPNRTSSKVVNLSCLGSLSISAADSIISSTSSL